MDIRREEFKFRHKPHVLKQESFSSLGKHTQGETRGSVRALLFKYKEGCSLSWPSERSLSTSHLKVIRLAMQGPLLYLNTAQISIWSYCLLPNILLQTCLAYKQYIYQDILVSRYPTRVFCGWENWSWFLSDHKIL